jgi:tetratricopeptide (TPR) repeat protein
LALELAAARLKILTPEAVLRRLDRRLQLLTGGSPEMAARQQTMRDTIAWSHDLLADDEQTLFRRLAVFAGSFSLEEAEQICAAAGELELDLLDALTSLVDKSLLVVPELEAGDAVEIASFTMLETIKEYACECLAASGESVEMRRRHAEYYLRLAEQAEPELRGPGQEVWLARLERSHDNIRSALGWSMETGQIEIGLRIAGAIWWLWYTRGYLSEGRRWLEQQLACDATQGTPVAPLVRAGALRGAGVLATEQGDYAQATALTEESLALFRQIGDTRSVGTILTVLGSIAKYQADFTRAASMYEDALALFRSQGDIRSISVSLNNLGNLAKEQRDYPRAVALYEESLAMKRELGDKRGIAIVLSNIGTMAHAQGDYPHAVIAGEESVALLRELGDKDLAAALDTLGRAVLAQGDDRRAMDLYREGLTVSQLAGERQLMAFFLEGVGRVASAQNNPERAARLYGAGSGLREAIGAPLSPAEQALDAGYLDATRLKLGDARFEAAWEEGRRVSLEEAVTYALVDTH